MAKLIKTKAGSLDPEKTYTLILLHGDPDARDQYGDQLYPPRQIHSAKVRAFNPYGDDEVRYEAEGIQVAWMMGEWLETDTVIGFTPDQVLEAMES